MLRIAINGYGRIGRNFHRLTLDRPDMKVVAINSRANVDMRAHLLKHDSLHGRCHADVQVRDGHMIVNGRQVKIFAHKFIEEIPWKDENIDVVIDATGKNVTYENASKHLKSGAKRVIVSAPMKDDTPTFVIGVNEDQLKPEYHVVSNASCTTNCITPVLMVLDREFGIKNAFVSSIHAFTGSQNLLDNSNRDFRRARSTVMSIIPTTTGSIKAAGLILTNLKGKLDGLAFRVPIATSSCADMRLVFEKKVTSKMINDALTKASKEERLDGILGVNDEDLVSIDFKTDDRSAIVDTLLTKVVDGKYAQLVVWYDNEWAYAKRLVELALKVGELIEGR